MEPDIPNRCDNRCFDGAKYLRLLFFRNQPGPKYALLWGIDKYDVSGITPVLLLSTSFGSNGGDLALSHNGRFICGGSTLYRTSDFAALGSFNTYPRGAAFSPDDSLVYTSDFGTVNVFNANTFLPVGTISNDLEVLSGKLAMDSTGRYLFAGYTTYYYSSTGTIVFDTGVTNTAIWYLNNNVYVIGGYGPARPAGWSLVGVADFNRDGKPDYLLYNKSTRQTAIWYLNN
jgi:hypothetical protein